MGTKIPLPIANGFYRSSSLPFSCQRCVNWIPIVAESNALNDRALMDIPGLVQFATLSSYAARGGVTMGGVPYFVSGSYLYSIDRTGTKTQIGIITGTRKVSMAHNGVKLCIVVPGGSAYVFDKDLNTLQRISDPDYVPSDTVVFKDGYFIFTATDGDIFFISALNDPTDIDALDFGSAEANPDLILAAHVNHNELYILGELTIQFFQNNPTGSGFPFQSIQSAIIEKGIHARQSCVDFDNTFLFVGGGLNEGTAIWKVTGSSSVVKISTDSIDAEIQKFTRDEIANAYSMTFTLKGQFLALFTFESTTIPSKTFVYNATASAFSGRAEWFELQSGDNEDKWRVNCIIQAYGKLLCGDSVDGRIGYLDVNTFTDYGQTRHRMVTSSPYSDNEIPIFQGQMELTMTSGTGLQSGQGSDPQIRMDYSDDGGRTWSYPTSRSYGGIGEYGSLAIWRRLGRVPRHRVLRFQTSEPVQSDILKLCTYASQGTQ